MVSSHALNLVMPIEFSNFEQRTPKEKESRLLEGIVKNDLRLQKKRSRASIKEGGVLCSRGGVGR